MWVLGILTFLVPAGMAVVELGNLWPGQGGVYIWAHQDDGGDLGFHRRLSVVGAGDPQRRLVARCGALQFLLLAFHAELGVMTSVILQLVILWTVVGLALAKLAANQRIMNVVFVVFGILALTIFVAGLTFAMKNGSATPFSWRDATIPNFAVAGFLYGTVLLYLLGVETPYNMGAEFLSVRKSGPRMILWGSAALVVDLSADDARHDDGVAQRRDRRRDGCHRHARRRGLSWSDGDLRHRVGPDHRSSR